MPIFVTRPALPAFEEFEPLLRDIWESRHLTNGGPFHASFETKLAEYLDVPYVSLLDNGTSALVLALRALELTGEVITSPFSFVATAHSIRWANLTPKFADIDARTLNLSIDAVEEAITGQTAAIMPVHCYGTPCDVDGFERLSRRYGIPVIYDAAHAFGVQHKERSLLAYGDLSALSFHATKVFTTFEGGAIVSRNPEAKRRVDQLKNFGIASETTVELVGTNAKMSEFQAAFGLVELRHVDRFIARRLEIAATYDAVLAGVDGIETLARLEDTTSNGGYYPIRVRPPYRLSRDALYTHLKDQGIFTRRYFYPLITDFPMYRTDTHLPVAQAAAAEVLCLPIYPDLATIDAEGIANAIRRLAT